MQIKDSVFLIPGGASGLGAATARHLIEAGGKLVIADLNRDAGEKFVATLGGHAKFVLADVTSETQIQ
ncbi:MAG: 3-hydroxy-2-methylbutyryl-CoA dehydrogenase, partial [Betaproteobacteria bacterium]|nr:3-hydroxy-2-methylbutyryl-CoA dehydrogenase [Betaproteobacteria bacterium]